MGKSPSSKFMKMDLPADEANAEQLEMIPNPAKTSSSNKVNPDATPAKVDQKGNEDNHKGFVENKPLLDGDGKETTAIKVQPAGKSFFSKLFSKESKAVTGPTIADTPKFRN